MKADVGAGNVEIDVEQRAARSLCLVVQHLLPIAGQHALQPRHHTSVTARYDNGRHVASLQHVTSR